MSTSTKPSASFDVFISYSHIDSAPVAALDIALRASGLTVFLDQRNVLAGDRIVERVFDGIASAAAQLIVLSQTSTTSSWVLDELSAGRLRSITTGSRVIPVLIDDCDVPNALAHLKYVDLRDWLTDRSFRLGVSELLHALGHAYVSPDDSAIAWAMRYVVELHQLDIELRYVVAHLDGGISEMTGGLRGWTSYKHALNDVRLGMFLLDDSGTVWPDDLFGDATSARVRHSGWVAGGLELIEHWLTASQIPMDVPKTRVLADSVESLKTFLCDRGITPWGRVMATTAARAGAIGDDGCELRSEIRRVAEAVHQLITDVLRLTVPLPALLDTLGGCR
jgi:hypothetical protein